MADEVPLIQVIHGPNLNLLGSREPDLYGAWTLAEIDDAMVALGRRRGYSVSGFQSNHEGALIDALHAARGEAVGVVINAGGLTHTSVALRDALLAVDVPAVEVHLTNPHRREVFRRRSLLSDVVVGVICGFGPGSYMLGISALIDHLEWTYRRDEPSR